MEATTVLLSFAFLAYLHSSIAHNSQCHQPYITINEVWRSTANEIKSGARPKCDRNYIVDNKWYRFDSSAGNEMPTTNPGYNKCGTIVPIWMDGTHPTVAEDEKDVTACAPVPFLAPPNCGVSFNIKVVNCSGFYIYRLKEPQECSLAYCAGLQNHTICYSI